MSHRHHEGSQPRSRGARPCKPSFYAAHPMQLGPGSPARASPKIAMTGYARVHTGYAQAKSTRAFLT
jgi:hypothetical protein